MEIYRLRQPPQPAGFWILGPLEQPTGQTRFYTRSRPRWIVRLLARLMFDCVWFGIPAPMPDGGGKVDQQ